MFLSQLLEGVRVTKLFEMQYGRTIVTQDVQINRVCYDSRKVGPGDLFVALRGNVADGHLFIDNAVANGATVVVVEDDSARADYFFLHSRVAKVVVPDSRAALARIAANYYKHPSRNLLLVGVTGTNGKTTTTHLLKSILEAGGDAAGLIGTIEYRLGTEVLAATHTTPESLELNELLAKMVAGGCKAAVMEVSSHALTQKRVDELRFRAGVFTNLTQDHLDYHGTMEEYFRAKRALFEKLGAEAVAVVNADDPRGHAIADQTQATRVTYGIEQDADVRASGVSITLAGIDLVVEYDGASTQVHSPLIGRFNVSNILAAFATAEALNVPPAQIVRGIAGLGSVRGRFELLSSPGGWTAVVDYAHTPDALENCLRTIRSLLPADGKGRIITVFGCGGNRDAGKRPIMGRIASELSDRVIITSDNPRREEPREIIRQILAGVGGNTDVMTEPDRRKAIIAALETARPGDVVLVAGKGHEAYQVVGDVKSRFDDREEIETYIHAHDATHSAGS